MVPLGAFFQRVGQYVANAPSKYLQAVILQKRAEGRKIFDRPSDPQEVCLIAACHRSGLRISIKEKMAAPSGN